MEDSRASEYLMHFGLSRQEALVYEQLLARGKQTGYIYDLQFTIYNLAARCNAV